MEAESKVCITEDEAQLYDRQIRLWGLDAQKRLRAAKVLVAGLSGLGCEVAKNLVLAGVNTLTIMDHEPLTKADLNSQFLASHDSVGSNRAESSLQRLQRLNPMVEVSADTSNLAEKTKEYFDGKFDIVIVTHCPSKDVLLSVNKICRESGIKFFSGDIYGFFGYCFADLIDHEYVEEVIKVQDCSSDVSRSGEPPAKKSKPSENASEEPETKMVKHNLKYCSLEDALKVDWTAQSLARRIKRMDPSYFVLQMIFEFQSREGASPNVNQKEKDLALLTSLHSSISEKYDLPEGKISSEILPLLFSELSPVSAIVGGILAQEVIKTISNRDAPHKNFFFYNPIESSGVVEMIGY